MLRFLKMFVLGVVLTIGIAQAAPTAPEAAFVDILGQQALSILADKSMPRAAALDKFKAMLNTNFDLPSIGRFVLGRWYNVATPAEQNEYQSLFTKMVERIYTDRFSLYSGETFTITGTRPDTGADSIVSSQVVRPNGPPVNVDWRVRKQADGKSFKIVDVIVEGVSMSVTQRAEYASVIQRGGGNVESLLKMMREKVAAPLPATTSAAAQ